MNTSGTLWHAIVLAGVLTLAMAFKPWQVLRHRPLQIPWLVAVLLLPWVWWSRALSPFDMELQLSGACLLVLMFGWPMAMLMSALLGLITAVLTAYGPSGSGSLPVTGYIIAQILWFGMVPGTLALLIGLALRRWLPHHLFIYILGRGFFTTVVANALSALVALTTRQQPAGLSATDWLLGHWLLAWGEGLATGMLVAIFVAFRPRWLLTYSDDRYLPGKRP